MKKLARILLALSVMVLAGCAPVRPEQAMDPTERLEAATSLPTAPEELICGVSVLEDISRHYQAAFPDQEVYGELRDLDGNGWKDLAVWYNHSFRALYLMGEGYVLWKEILPEQGFLLMECWQGDRVCKTDLIYTIGAENFNTIYSYYTIQNGALCLWEALKYDGTGEPKKFFMRNADAEEWTPISDETYREKLGSYQVKPDALKPVGEYASR